VTPAHVPVAGQVPAQQVPGSVHRAPSGRHGSALQRWATQLPLQQSESVLQAMASAEQGFTTNLPLEEIANDDVLLADTHDGAPLTPEHGWPLRLVVPRRYFWKSAKWIRSIELDATDRPGFWEQNGYHNEANPWNEERFSDW
jgi:DMSO/TMAO reductase YedYZ molybdopterin-dependent catalytic subunit